MGELPAGYQIPKIKVSEPHLSASAVVSRIIDGQDEILLGHRVSEMPSFPDFWTFPGGGISKVDKKVGEKYPDFLSEMGIDRIATIALLRELVEEIGLTPDENGKMIPVNQEIRSLVCNDKNNWFKSIANGNINIEFF
ncbi:MAG: NUDIX domain-containing protein, partial [Candidatus Thalassarchaeaceae archaeon]